LRLLLLSLTSSALLYLCFFPVAWGWLGWVALVPWLGLVRSEAWPRILYLIAFVSGLALYVPVLQWMRVADDRMYVTWILLAIICAAYFPLGLWMLRWLERRTTLPLVLMLPAVWTALEFLRAYFASGFPWYFLGHTQHGFSHLIQIADVTGAYGITFLVAAVNAVLFEALWQKGWFRAWYGQRATMPRCSRPGLLAQGLVLLLVLLGVLGYGTWRLSQDTMTPGPRVALIQGNVPQQIRNEGSGLPGDQQLKALRRIASHYVGLANLAMAYGPDLIAWPETSFPGNWRQLAAGHTRQNIPPDWKDAEDEAEEGAETIARKWPTTSLLGLDASILEADNKPRRYNSALLIGPRGRVEGRYDKIHRVPFGEYVPLREWIPAMNRLAPYDYEYEVAPGTSYPRLPLDERSSRHASVAHRYTFGATICFEDTDPSVGRPYGGSDGLAPVDFLVNISNEGWFDGTAEHDEHLAICRFRAVEVRRGVARSVNMGISAVIDSNGRVLQPYRIPQPETLGLFATAPAAGPVAGLPWLSLYLHHTGVQVWNVPGDKASWRELPVAQWADYKKVHGVLLATVPIDNRASVYARWGDWLPWSCWGLLLVAGLWTFVRPSGRTGVE